MILIGLLTMLLVIGIKESANFNNVIVFVKVAIVFLVIGFGAMYVNTANWHPFIPPNTGEFGHFGITGIVRGAAVVFFAYIGFDAVSTAAQEAKNPQKDMPIGILLSLGICTVLYILMSLVMTGLAPYTTLNVPHPVYVAIDDGRPGTHVARPDHQARRDRRPRVGGARHAHGAAARLLLDVARRAAPAARSARCTRSSRRRTSRRS